MKAFLNSIWNFVLFEVSSPIISPPIKIWKIPLPLLILKNFSSPRISLSSKIQSPPPPPFTKGGEATMICIGPGNFVKTTDIVIESFPQNENDGNEYSLP